MTRRVLITGARAAAALDLARDFAAAGWTVHLADCVKVRMARWSRVNANHHRYPSPRQQGPSFQRWIAQFVDQHDIDLIVPTCEEVFHLSAASLHTRLGEKLFAPDLATLRNLHDKLAFARSCTGWGLDVPESHSIEDAEALGPFMDRSCGWVFKPRFSRFGDKALIAPHSGEVARIEPTPDAPWMAQGCISGEEACFHAIAHHGKLIAYAAYRSDWRLGGGARYAFEPLDARHAEALREIAEKLANSAGIHGQFACDVMLGLDGKYYLLECNPRATSGVHLLVGNGDLAKAIKAGRPMAQPASGAAYLAPAMALFGLPLALRDHRLGEWKALLTTGRDAISRPGDRAPIVGAMADAAGFFLTGLRHGISTNAATTFDIEWNGEELD